MNKRLETTREMKDSGIEWIGEIPKTWGLPLLGTHFKERSEKVNDKDFPPLSVTKKGVVPQLENVAKTDNNDNRKKICVNDFVINSRSDRKGSSGLSKYEGSTSNISIVLQLKDIFPMYAHYLLKSQGFTEEFYRWGSGIVADLWSTRYSSMKKINIPLPPLHEQQAIANYLDEQVGKMDRLISEQKQAIEQWKTYKQSLITETVTKGLNSDAPMKDSGIEWVGEIPSDWETVFINQLFTQLKNKNTEMQETNLLSLSYGKIVRKNIETREGLLPENFNGYNIINAGDIVLRLTDLQNDQRSLRCGIAKERGIITSAYVTLRNIKPLVNNYYYYLIHAYDIMKVFYGMGSGVRQGLTFDGLKKMRLLVPSIENQQQIADYLDDKCAKIDQTIEQKQALIKQLEEYKQSLIYECVTGKRWVH